MSATMRELMRFPSARRRDPGVEAWFDQHPTDLAAIARRWFEALRDCGDDVRELIHDGCPVACVGDAAFAYVNVFKAHASLGFFQGAALKDPARMLEGQGKFMRHVKLRPGAMPNPDALEALVRVAYDDCRLRAGDAGRRVDRLVR